MKALKTPLAILTLGLTLTLAGLQTAATANVFDMPQLHTRHFQLLGIMNEAHKERRFTSMEQACREGAALGSDPALWHYNLGCALALQNRVDEALDALHRAMADGFLDVEHTAADEDLISLRGHADFTALLTRMRELEDSPKHKARRPTPLAPNADGIIMQTTSNTLWSYEYGVFNTLITTPTNPPTTAYRGPCAQEITHWQAQGSATGAAGIIYLNRDDNSDHSIDLSHFPGLARIEYSQDVTARKLSFGAPNTLFIDAATQQLAPTIGHCAMGFLSVGYWRSLPRGICSDPRQAMQQPLFLLSNQLLFYNAQNDYTAEHGDLFTVNNPCLISVAGTNGSERVFAEAAVAAICALQPTTRAHLIRERTLMPTLNMLLRLTQKQLSTPEHYLTGRAHPVALSPQNLDTPKLVAAAHALTTNNLPPTAFIKVVRESQATAGRDFFDDAQSEQLFDSPFAIARVFRGVARTRSYELEADSDDPNTTLHWTLLQGNPELITFTPCPTNNNRITVHVAHHTPFAVASPGDSKIISTRVDIAAIAQRGSQYSMPAILSIYFLNNEKRTYTNDGRILAVDYTWPQSGYTDPMLSLPRNWRDEYLYDDHGRMTGWHRIRGLSRERFTVYGHRVISTDPLGRANQAHQIRYMQRKIRTATTESELPDLAEVDDNIALTYHYASPSDHIGQPRPTTH